MTKAKKVARADFDDVDLTRKTEEARAEPIDPADEELDNVFREFPQHDACLELWRTTEKGGKPVFVDDISPTDFSFGNIARTWGGGVYLVKGKYKGGDVIKRSFEVAGDPFPIKRKIPQQSGNAPVVSAPAQTVEMRRSDDGSYDMGAVLTGVMTTFQKMVTELKTSEVEMLEKMKMYKELFGSHEKPQTPVAEAISMIKTGIELGQAGGEGGGGGGIPWMMVIDKLQGPLTEIATSLVQAMKGPRAMPGAMAPPNALTPNPQPTESANGQPEPVIPQGEQMTMILVGALKSMLPMLVTGAAKEADPGFYADLLLDQIPRQYYATAKDWLEKPDCLDQLQTMNAGVGAHLIWFGSLRAELLKALIEELGGDAAGSVQPGPTPDATSDGQTDL